LVRWRRHRRRRAASRGRLTPFLLAAGLALVLTTGAGLVSGGRVLFAAAAELPSASSLESLFGPHGGEMFRPVQLYDRSEAVLLAEVIHPLARERQWQPLDRLPASVEEATVAALDPSFWTNAGYDPAATGRTVLRSILGGETGQGPLTLTERLARQTLVRGENPALAGALLAAEIAAAYPKERVLEWFLNSADYGNLAFGIDAASRVYLGKPADRLTLGEAALLAALPAHPEVDPVADPAAAWELQAEVLASMREQGRITAEQARRAKDEPITLQANEARRAIQGLGFVSVVWEELRARIGAGAAAQGGARVVTTLDLDLQLQADCVARSYLVRMEGGDPFAVLPAADGSPCAAASLLPPLRPGDAGVDHQVDSAATILLNPDTGEVLAITGPAGERRSAGDVLAPFVFLSAFSRGYTPATMVMATGDGGAPGGPIRLRTALVEGNSSVTDQLLEALGPRVVDSTLALMGLEVGEGRPVRLDRLIWALGLLAHQGVQSGFVSGVDNIEASTIQSVYSPEGEALYQAAAGKRSVISEGLAFLLNHVLSDETARQAAYGPGSPLQIGRPAAAVTHSTSTDNWTLGYTPQLAVGVWVGAEGDGTLTGVNDLNGAAPIWHALIRYASRDLPPTGWPTPPDVTELEVCDPSGYLPTPYCPQTVREVFLSGTEPRHSDTLYRPFRINKETGRLATYFTPLDQIEEVVYFVPPAEAEAWAEAEGLAAPPTEYDRIALPAPGGGDVSMTAPGFFDTVRGTVEVVGTAAGEQFDSYRLDVGEGLDPQAWQQIGETRASPVRNGRLGSWDTSSSNGAAILRLTVVRKDGTVDTAAVPVTIDNRPPAVEIVLPIEGAEFSPADGREIAIQMEASDDASLDRIVLFVDDRAFQTLSGPAWVAHWPLGAAGAHRLRARAYDAAGNWQDSDEIAIRVVR
jgi:membrane peptidoglycan carboxypeptidase